jgi:pimeloyl-ACP methyl ester carboxylesterase
VTAANHITAATIVERLRNGTLIGGVAPVEVEKVIGMGQSMGGCFLIVQQAVHRTFDAIAILGYASVRSGFPTPNGAMSPSPVMNLDALRFAFHAPDEDSRLVEADFPSVMPAAGHQQPWRASAMPAIAVEGAVPGAVSTEAAAIDVPVLLAYGETDLVANPWIEPSGFSKSRDVSLFVVPRMAHMHNFAQTRMLLWQRIDHFACCA